MKKLYLIGNGFDLHHSLDTKYVSFGVFLKNNYPTIYGYLIYYFGFSDIDINDKSTHNDILWAEFEKRLALMDTDSVIDAHSDSIVEVAERDRDWYTFKIDMEMIVEEVTVNLFKAFKEFILNVEYPKQADDKKLPLDTAALYLTFNYTDTLERYYGVPRENILYIHEKAELNDNVLILGHGVDPENFKSEDPKPPEGLTAEEYEQWREHMCDNYNLSYELGKDELLNYFSTAFKETKRIINENQSFFKKLKNISEVIILGHSLSEIDMPYFAEIFNSVKNNAIWVATYYGEGENLTHKDTLKYLGICQDNIKLINISELL